jgi:hypothetical protein
MLLTTFPITNINPFFGPKISRNVLPFHKLPRKLQKYPAINRNSLSINSTKLTGPHKVLLNDAYFPIALTSSLKHSNNLIKPNRIATNESDNALSANKTHLIKDVLQTNFFLFQIIIQKK